LTPVISSTHGVNLDRGTLAETVSVVDNNGMPGHNMITFITLLTKRYNSSGPNWTFHKVLASFPVSGFYLSSNFQDGRLTLVSCLPLLI